MGNKSLIKIVCPKCGTQYLPGEIYLPKAFLGQPKKVTKDFAGRILDFQGSTMDTRETYICDKCDCKFSVRAQVQFYTEAKETTNTTQPFKMKIGKEKDAGKLILAEK